VTGAEGWPLANTVSLASRQLCRACASVRIELDAARGKVARRMVSQRQVHVVAAEQDVIADGHARQDELAGLL